MDRVRLAIVGCGYISVLSAPGYLEHPQCDVAALCDSIRERAEGRAREWGIDPKIYTRYEDVLDDPEIDAVELLTPTHMHARQSIEALDAGKTASRPSTSPALTNCPSGARWRPRTSSSRYRVPKARYG